MVRTLLSGGKQSIDAVNDQRRNSAFNSLPERQSADCPTADRCRGECKQSPAERAPPHFAACQGNSFIGKALLQANAGIDTQNEDGTTPLIVAAQKGNNDFVSLLIEQNANVNLADNSQFTALHYASTNGFTEIVESLLMAGAEG